MRKFVLKLRCRDCSHRYRRTVSVPDDQTVDDIDDPPCPACGKREKSIGFDPRGKPPSIGGSNTTKAIDLTDEIVASDHKFTDLNDRPHEGENSVPKLAPALQRQVDNFWGGKKNRVAGINTAALGRQAMAGAFAPGRVGGPDVVKMSHDAKHKVPVSIVESDRKG